MIYLPYFILISSHSFVKSCTLPSRVAGWTWMASSCEDSRRSTPWKRGLDGNHDGNHGNLENSSEAMINGYNGGEMVVKMGSI